MVLTHAERLAKKQVVYSVNIMIFIFIILLLTYIFIILILLLSQSQRHWIKVTGQSILALILRIFLNSSLVYLPMYLAVRNLARKYFKNLNYYNYCSYI